MRYCRNTRYCRSGLLIAAVAKLLVVPELALISHHPNWVMVR